MRAPGRGLELAADVCLVLACDGSMDVCSHQGVTAVATRATEVMPPPKPLRAHTEVLLPHPQPYTLNPKL